MSLGVISNIISFSIILVFLLKLLDCVFGTLKSITLYKNMHFWSAVCNTVSTAMYAVSMVLIVKDNSWESMVALCSAAFLGNYLPSKTIDRLEKDGLYIYEITSNTLDRGKDFADKLRNYNIPVNTTTIRNNKMEKVLLCRVYSQSKESSRVVEAILPNDFKYTINTSVITEQ